MDWRALNRMANELRRADEREQLPERCDMCSDTPAVWDHCPDGDCTSSHHYHCHHCCYMMLFDDDGRLL